MHVKNFDMNELDQPVRLLNQVFNDNLTIHYIADSILKSQVFGIIDRNALIGCAWYSLDQKLGNFKTIHLNRIGILNSYQNKRYGTTLLTESLDILKNQPSEAELFSLFCKRNEYLLSYYQKSGFFEYGTNYEEQENYCYMIKRK